MARRALLLVLGDAGSRRGQSDSRSQACRWLLGVSTCPARRRERPLDRGSLRVCKAGSRPLRDDEDEKEAGVSIAHLGLAENRQPARTGRRSALPLTTSSPSRARSAACSSAKTPSPTSSSRAGHRLLHSQARDHLRRDPVALLARRTDRRHRRHRRTDQDRRTLPRRRRRLPAHAHGPRPHRCQRRLLRIDRRRSAHSSAGWSRRAPASCRWATPPRARSLDLVNNAQAEIYGVTGCDRQRRLRPADRGRRRSPSTRSRPPGAKTAR